MDSCHCMYVCVFEGLQLAFCTSVTSYWDVVLVQLYNGLPVFAYTWFDLCAHVYGCVCVRLFVGRAKLFLAIRLPDICLHMLMIPACNECFCDRYHQPSFRITATN